MPWLPELFTAPALQQILDDRRRDELLAVPYFDGLLAGDPDPLVESFVGEPEVYDPVRGRVKGEAAFRAFVAETSAWLAQHHASVDEVDHVILERRGFEEVVLRLDPDRGGVDLPVAVVAERRPDGRIEELRLYFSGRPVLAHAITRPPVLQPDPDLALPAPLATYLEPLTAGADSRLETCSLIDDGRVCALEYNVVQPRTTLPSAEAGLAVFAVGGDGRLSAARVYDDAEAPFAPLT
jgi:hypothetical protein